MGSSEGGNVMNQASRQYGVTKPISTSGPTDVDLQRSAELEKVCAFTSYFVKIFSFFDVELVC